MGQPLLVFGASIIFEAIDPSTDLPVTGVTVSDPVVAGVNLSDTSTPEQPSTVEPLWLPIPTDQINAAG